MQYHVGGLTEYNPARSIVNFVQMASFTSLRAAMASSFNFKKVARPLLSIGWIALESFVLFALGRELRGSVNIGPFDVAASLIFVSSASLIVFLLGDLYFVIAGRYPSIIDKFFSTTVGVIISLVAIVVWIIEMGWVLLGLLIAGFMSLADPPEGPPLWALVLVPLTLGLHVSLMGYLVRCFWYGLKSLYPATHEGSIQLPM